MSTGPIVHIGYHKTATTWLQKRLFPLAPGHVRVPRRVVQEALLAPSAFAFDPGRARDLLGMDSGQGTVPIVSDEELSGNPHSGGMRGSFSMDVASRIARTLPEARILVMIRNQVDMTAALYRHYVREGGTHGPERYFRPERYRRDVARHPFKYPLFSFDHLDYGGLIGEYRRLFGPERVLVLPFETFRADPPGVTRELCGRLGLAVDPDGLDYSRQSPAQGANALRLGRFLNHFTYRSVLDKRWCLRLVSSKLRSDLPLWLDRTPLRGRVQPPGELLGAELVAGIEARFAAPNRTLAALTGLPLAALGYPCGTDRQPRSRGEA